MSAHAVETLAVVLLLARDTERTAAFYADVLGLPVLPEEHDGRARHFACQTGSIYFTIQPASDFDGRQPETSYDFLQLCFTVSDLDGFLRRLEGRSVAPLHEPRAFEHTRFVTLLDPDGRHVRIMTPWGRTA